MTTQTLVPYVSESSESSSLCNTAKLDLGGTVKGDLRASSSDILHIKQVSEVVDLFPLVSGDSIAKSSPFTMIRYREKQCFVTIKKQFKSNLLWFTVH